MPKRATHTFESEKDGVSDQALVVQYCLCCGESVLILGPSVVLTDLPKRRTDGAIVLERGSTVFKLKTVPKETKLVKRVGGFERQHRLGCWNCGVRVAYRCEEGENAALTYLLPDATGTQADLYLQMNQVPPCIQSTGEKSVRVAMDVQAGQSKRAVTAVSDAAVEASVCAPSKDGLANAELLDFMQKVLSVTRQQLSLARGWSQSSKFLLISSMEAVDVFKRLKAAVENDILPLGAVGPPPKPGDDPDATDVGPAATAGAASFQARKNWEEGEDLEELAVAPSRGQQKFIN